ncbi:hypothetical protein QQF73_04555 [Marinobacter sp. M216]|uniref:Uncharacterized protein n=1 Tax=Marinobacter albus TaxID=3030833 RepID=A0ABT7H961_9GAMM|nr:MULTISPECIES: hypothetical protein [unclassified Marinobacter]MBW7470844.1 hypothetical protein [Marinobacter sp. F4218]MDK9556886.1 hypothetical protein [Marinobacter sp. M216]
MKWIILIIIIAGLAYWLNKGRRRNNIEDPDMKTFEEKDFYLTSNDNASDDKSSPDKNNPRH